jgi:hypothetical protein
MADLDADSRYMHIHAGPVIVVVPPVIVMVANNDPGVGMIDALGNA